MKANIVVGLDGSINIVTQEGSFEAGKEKIEKLLEQLKASGLEVSLDNPIEQHRHDEEGNHIHVHSH